MTAALGSSATRASSPGGSWQSRKLEAVLLAALLFSGSLAVRVFCYGSSVQRWPAPALVHLRPTAAPALADAPWAQASGVHCGAGWQAAYQRMHAAAVQRPQPRLLRLSMHAGLGNSLGAIVTAFYISLLTDRALVILPKNRRSDCPLPFEYVFQAPRVNWSDPLGGQNFSEVLDVKWGYLFEAGDLTLNDEAREVVHTLRSGNITQLKNDAAVLDLVAGAPFQRHIFNNPYHREQFFRWGLHEDNAYGCAVRYLFEPHPRLRQRFAREFQQLMDPVPLKIGIHARLGDEAAFHFRNTSESFATQERFVHAFRCAQQLQERFAVGGRPVLWYVISDDRRFRELAAQRYGDKVLTSAGNITHIDETRPASHTAALDGFELAAGEYWLYSLADFHVVVATAGRPVVSSYSNGAAAASLRSNSVVHINIDDDGLDELNCEDKLRQAREDWAAH